MISPRKFGEILINWSASNSRELPWIKLKDPYKIWISEIMLQQTRVDQVIPFYNRFIKKFPTVKNLAEAEEKEVLLYWEGLGYYSRARNLHFAAQEIEGRFGGKFPKTYEEIKSLKGIGDYTAAAIASFAFEYSIAAIDGNAIRILSRVFGKKWFPHIASDKKAYQELANKALGKLRSSNFNQAIMDFGSSICKPKLPECKFCPFEEECYAHKYEQVADFPPQKPQIHKKTRYFHYFLLLDPEGSSLISLRRGDDIWKGLHELVLHETDKRGKLTSRQQQAIIEKEFKILSISKSEVKSIIHKLTHQNLEVNFYKIYLAKKLVLKNKSSYKVESVENFLNFAFPRPIRNYLNQEITKLDYVKQGTFNR